MNIWLAISLVLAVVTVYLFVIEVFSVAFKLTGLVTSKIKFQVASLFTSSGYTTAESELIAKDEKRRKIAIACMYTGHIFSVAFMGLVINLVISLSLVVGRDAETPHFNEWYFIVLYITLGFFILMLLLKVPLINKKFQRFLEKIAIKLSRSNKQSNVVTVLDLQGKHAIAEVVLNIVPDYANEVPLSEMKTLRNLSIIVLSLRRDGRVIEVSKDTMFKKGDILVLYGLSNDIKEAFVNHLKNHKIEEIDKSNEINLINNYGSNSLVEVFVEEVPQELEDISIEDSKIKDKYGINVTIIKRNNEYLLANKDTHIQKGDTITLYGPYKNIKVLFKNYEG